MVMGRCAVLRRRQVNESDDSNAQPNRWGLAVVKCSSFQKRTRATEARPLKRQDA